MKKLLPVMFAVISSLLVAGCSGGDESNVEVVISSSPLPLIPATAISCLATKNAAGDTATADITANYFKIPKITFNRKNTTKILVVAFLRIKIQIPGSSSQYICEYGGDGLASLSSTWWANAGKEASVSVGAASFATDCPLYCGGVEAANPYTATGTVEVFGLERDATSLEETPVKVQTSITVQSY